MSTTTDTRTLAERLGVILSWLNTQQAGYGRAMLRDEITRLSTAVGYCSDCGEPIQPEDAGRASWGDECNDYSCWTWRCPTCGEPGSTSVN